jgi:hypothetical protein
MTLPPYSSIPTVPMGFEPFSRWMNATFRLFAAQWTIWVLQGLIVFLCTAVPIGVIYMVMFFTVFAGAVTSPGGSEPPAYLLFGFMGIIGIVVFLSMFLSVYFFAGMTQTALKQLRGEPIAVNDLFTGGRSYWPVLGTSIIVGFLSMLGAICCYIPAFLVGGVYLPTIPLIVDRRIGVTEALSTSWAIGRQNILLFAVYYFILALVLSIFFIATLPIYIIGETVAYYDLTYGLPDEGATGTAPSGYLPPTPPYQPPPQAP